MCVGVALPRMWAAQPALTACTAYMGKSPIANRKHSANVAANSRNQDKRSILSTCELRSFMVVVCPSELWFRSCNFGQFVVWSIQVDDLKLFVRNCQIRICSCAMWLRLRTNTVF